MVAWAANFIVVKAANAEIPPTTFAFLRFLIAGATLLLLLRWREGAIGLPRHDVLPVLALGGLGFGVYQILWSVALQDIPAGDSALLVAITPVLTALIAVRIGVDVLTRSKLVGSLISFGGVVVIVASGPGIKLGSALVGDLLTIGAAVCWSTYTAFGAPILRRHSPLRTTAWTMVGGAIVLSVPALIQGAGTDWPSVHGEAWAGLAFAAFIPAGIANVMVFSAIKLLGPTRVSIYQFLVPFIAVLLGAALLHEPMRAEQLVGGAVIVLGVVIARSDRLTAFGGWLRGPNPA
jgi:drug/metabolite transporter (DMT)-like permease